MCLYVCVAHLATSLLAQTEEGTRLSGQSETLTLPVLIAAALGRDPRCGARLGGPRHIGSTLAHEQHMMPALSCQDNSLTGGSTRTSSSCSCSLVVIVAVVVVVVVEVLVVVVEVVAIVVQ